MGLLDGLEPHKKARPCRVRSVLSELDKKDAEILVAALNSVESWAAKTLSNALKIRGVLVSDSAIASHRRGSCSCGKIS
jgi:hypothetical protein